MRNLLFLPLALMLASCMSPTPMPAGFTYENEMYKSPPGPTTSAHTLKEKNTNCKDGCND